MEIKKMLLGQICLETMKHKWEAGFDTYKDIEFKVFSQFGEDGIIQYLINTTDIKNETFIEFGVENYLESNTRFLLLHDNWSGYVLDGSKKNINYIQNDDIYWKYDLTAVDAFIHKDNINDLIKQSGFSKNVGVLSIDIDGNDYWIWETIDEITPSIVICEYNALFGEKDAMELISHMPVVDIKTGETKSIMERKS